MRLGLAPINPTIADIAGNARLIADAANAARDAGCDVLLLPELALSGYPPRDLLHRDEFVRACAEGAREVGARASAGLTLIFGSPEPKDQSHPARGVHNALLAFRDGALLAAYHKRLLPTYDVFDEDRYFMPGSAPCVLEVPTRGGATVRVGLSICEDLWRGEDAGFSARYEHATDPVRELAQRGAQVILSASASPFVLGKSSRHTAILRGHAQRHTIPVASVNQLGGNDELVFDGHRLLVDASGAVAHDAPRFREGLSVIDVFAPGSGDSRREDDAMSDLWDALTLGLRDYIRKTGFQRAIIGLSGGIDSALTAALAAAALGSDRVLGVSMPGPYSSEHSKDDAIDLAERLGVRLISVPLAEGFDGLRAVADRAFIELRQPALGASLPDLAEENLQSRVRGTILMTLSNRTGAMVLTTGNKSEMAVGYATLYGDMNGGLAVLSDVSKTDVFALSRWINQHHKACGFAQSPIPQRTLTKPPSAELRPDQTDQDTLPPYDLLDRVIDLYVEEHRSAAQIAQAVSQPLDQVARICRMIDLAEYKRRQAAVGLKVTSVAFGSGRRMPVAQRWRPASGSSRSGVW